MLVGIIPAKLDFSHPADRRRPVYYMRKVGIDFELAEFTKHYDCVYLTISADLSRWSLYKSQWLNSAKRPKVVFDFCDDLLAESFFKDFMRAAFYFVSSKNTRFRSSYKTTILEMIRASDVVVCGSVEQKIKLSKFHDNVLIIRDYFRGDIKLKKPSYELKNDGELHILWEGFSHGNIEVFRLLRSALDTVKTHQIHLHVVTDPTYCMVGGRYLCKTTYDVLSKVFKDSTTRFHLYDWCSSTFSAIATSCDLAVIPIPNVSLMRSKPENKLLLLWELGLPVIVSDTPSYARVMGKANLDYVVSEFSQWSDTIGNLAESVENRIEYIRKSNDYLEEFCSDQVIDTTWEKVFF
jgi:hypothetical protein